jgi:hypothetical protein
MLSVIKSKAKEVLNKTTVDDKLLAGVKTLHKEYKSSLTTALSAALAFVMALYIRDLVKEWITWILGVLEISEGTGLIYQTIIALIVLTICVIGIVFLSRWTAKE